MPPLASTSAVAPEVTNTTALAEVVSRRKSSVGRVKESFAAINAQEKGKHPLIDSTPMDLCRDSKKED